MIEYDCEGCGSRVLGYGRSTIPKSHLCSVCEWFNEFVPDPEAMIQEMLRVGFLEAHPARPAARGPRKLGIPLSQLSGRPGHPGYDAFKRIARSWGHD